MRVSVKTISLDLLLTTFLIKSKVLINWFQDAAPVWTRRIKLILKTCHNIMMLIQATYNFKTFCLMKSYCFGSISRCYYRVNISLNLMIILVSTDTITIAAVKVDCRKVYDTFHTWLYLLLIYNENGQLTHIIIKQRTTSRCTSHFWAILL